MRFHYVSYSPEVYITIWHHARFEKTYLMSSYVIILMRSIRQLPYASCWGINLALTMYFKASSCANYGFDSSVKEAECWGFNVWSGSTNLKAKTSTGKAKIEYVNVHLLKANPGWSINTNDLYHNSIQNPSDRMYLDRVDAWKQWGEMFDLDLEGWMTLSEIPRGCNLKRVQT